MNNFETVFGSALWVPGTDPPPTKCLVSQARENVSLNELDGREPEQTRCLYQWCPVAVNSDLPSRAFFSGCKKSGEQQWVARSGQEVGVLVCEDGVAKEFRIRGAVGGEVLVLAPGARGEWRDVKRMDPLPDDVVQCGSKIVVRIADGLCGTVHLKDGVFHSAHTDTTSAKKEGAVIVVRAAREDELDDAEREAMGADNSVVPKLSVPDVRSARCESVPQQTESVPEHTESVPEVSISWADRQRISEEIQVIAMNLQDELEAKNARIAQLESELAGSLPPPSPACSPSTAPSTPPPTSKMSSPLATSQMPMSSLLPLLSLIMPVPWGQEMGRSLVASAEEEQGKELLASIDAVRTRVSGVQSLAKTLCETDIHNPNLASNFEETVVSLHEVMTNFVLLMQRLQDKEMVRLKFCRSVYDTAVLPLRGLTDATAEMLLAVEHLTSSGPIKEGGGCGLDGADNATLTETILVAWKWRLALDSSVQVFKEDVWDKFHVLVAGYARALEDTTSAGEVQAQSKSGPPQLMKGKGKGKGKDKGKGPGMAPGGAPKKVLSKPSDNEADTNLDAANRAACERRNRQIFVGAKDRQLVDVEKHNDTWVNVCSFDAARGDLDRVDITKAFGGRGRLLLHACIPHARKEKVQDTKQRPKHISYFKGDHAYALRVKDLHPVTEDFVGQGLSLPSSAHPWRVTVEVARGFASLDWRTLRGMDARKDCQLDLLLPVMDIPLHMKYPNPNRTSEPSSHEEKLVIKQLEMAEKIFGDDQVRRNLSEYNGPLTGLDELDRKYLVFSTVPTAARVSQFKFLNVEKYLEEEADRLEEEIELVINAISQICESPCLRDMLTVMLQVTCYINYFGDAHHEGVGFLLNKIDKYTSFAISKDYSLRQVVCAFLGNLRPSKPNTMNFMDRMRKELELVHQVVRRSESMLLELKKPNAKLQTVPELLENRVTAVLDLLPYVRAMMRQESDILGPFAKVEHLTAYAAELHLRAKGREHMNRCLAHIEEVGARLSGRMNVLAGKEKDLRRFACFKGADVEDSPVRYFQIMASVISFVDDLHTSWMEQEAKPQVMADVQVALLRMAPLQIVFKRNEDGCLKDTYALWSGKVNIQRSPAKKQRRPWRSQEKTESLSSLFHLFDSDASGSIDAAEISVLLRGLGFDVPVDFAVNLVKFYDEHGEGLLTQHEFERFVGGEIQRVFSMFTQTSSITADDLMRVARKYDLDTDEKHIKEMIDLFDSEKLGAVGKEEFEQLILQPVGGAQGKKALAAVQLTDELMEFGGQEYDDGNLKS